MTALLGNEAVAIRATTGITDQSGNGLDGTYNGGMGTVADTGEGGTLAFLHADSDDWISIGDVLTPTNALSGALWVKTTNRDTSQFLMAHYGDSGQRSWYFLILNGGKLRVVVSNNGTDIWVEETNAVAVTNDLWHHLGWSYDGTAQDIVIYVDGVAVASQKATSVTGQLSAIPTSLHNSTAPIYLGARAQTGSALPIIGRSDDFRVFTSVLTAPNFAAMAVDRAAVASDSVSLTPDTRVVQRGDALTIAGSYNGADATDVQVRVLLDSDDSVVADWATVDSDLSAGSWSGSVTLAAGGPYYLQARLRDSGGTTIATSTDSGTILVGDVFVCSGQSNMLGRGVAQTYSGSQTVWHVREDGDIVESIDDPSSDNSADVDGAGPLSIGSMRPLLADLIAADQACPVIMLLNAKGGQRISAWDRPSGAMWTAYTAMLAGANPTSVKAILWYQGETDAHNDYATASYIADELALVTAFVGELSNTPPVITALLGESNTTSSQDKINAAKIHNWGNATTKAGPVTNWKDLTDDDLHWVSDTDLAQLAAMWWLALDEHLYSGPSSQLTIVSATHSDTTITVTVSQDLDTADTSYTTTAWTVENAGGTARTVSAVTRTGARTIAITVSGVLDGTPTLTYGSQETAVGATVPRAVAVNLPATINSVSSFGVRLRPSFDVAIVPASSGLENTDLWAQLRTIAINAGFVLQRVS